MQNPHNPNDIMPEECRQAFAHTRAMHEYLYRVIEMLKGDAPAKPVEELANAAYAARQTYELLDDIRKQCKGLCELLEKLACLKFLGDAANANRKNIKTQYCTASPDMSVNAAIPKWEKDPQAYESLMRWLGIDEMLWDKGEYIDELSGKQYTEVVAVQWPGFQSLIARMQAAALPLPDGIDPEKTYVIHKLAIRKRKGVLE